MAKTCALCCSSLETGSTNWANYDSRTFGIGHWKNPTQVAILDPRHLLDQADALLAETDAGPRCQVDLRRAISAAYYSVFHTVTCAAADQVVGSAKRSTPGYTLVYRGIDHRALNNFCLMASRPTLPPKYQGCCPNGGFGDDIRQFGRSVIIPAPLTARAQPNTRSKIRSTAR